MSILLYLKKFVMNPEIRFGYLSKIGFYNMMSDRKYISKCYRIKMGKKLNLDNPVTFNEKIQWLKLYDRKDEYTSMVDKLGAKKYVADRIGEEYIIPTYGVWDKFDDINFDDLPDQFVLKCTHDSGGLVICHDKNTFDKQKAKKKIECSLKRNFYLIGREWPYKNVPRKIVAERYMEDAETEELRDYKFFCFNGKVKCFKIDFDRFIGHRANYFTPEGETLPFGEITCPPDFSRKLVMPYSLKKMIEFAEELSADIPFLRVDFYEVNKQIYFGELTFFPASGFGKFDPEEWDYTFGNWLVLPTKK